MATESATVAQISQVIRDVTAPAFLLGAIAGFIALLISRMNRVIDRSQALNAIGDNDDVKGHLRSDIPRLQRRAALLNRAILFSTISAIVASFLVIVSFASAYLNVQHEYGVGLLFILSIGFFMMSLINLALETRIALHEYDHFGGK
jgi:uncharacterized membrane protein (DUF485 family)